MNCTQPNCEKPVHSKGLCDGHYHAQPHVLAQRRSRYKPESQKMKLRRKNRYQKAMKDPKFHKEFIETIRLKNQKDKLEVLNHYSNGKPICACCGINEPVFLTIDHINGGGRKHREVIKKKYATFYKYLIANHFPTGYQVLCFNCNLGKSWGKECPHKREKK